MNPLIQFDHVTYHHPGTGLETPPALSDITLSIQPGEWVSIVGANGSGKTTFARQCNALIEPTSGAVLINGKDTRQKENLPAIRSTIGMVFQNPEDQIVATIVEEDTAFGPENLAIRPGEIRERVDESLKTVDMFEHRLRAPHLLSAGQMQRVALAGVLSMRPECVIFDETTAMLDPRGRQEVLEEMQQLHANGITVLFITHFMEEATLADRILALNHGKIAFDGKPADLFKDQQTLEQCDLGQPAYLQLLNEMRKMNAVFKHLPDDFELALTSIPPYDGEIPQVENYRTPNKPESVLIKVENLQHTYMLNTPLAQPSLMDVSFTVNEGMAHGLAGATGSGKSTMLHHLNGLYRPQSGSVRVGPYILEDPNLDVKALRRFTGLVFQNPEFYFFEQYVGDEIAFGPKLLYGKEGLRERVSAAMNLVGLDFEKFKDRITSTLSGGEKRKVALAATLAIEPKILILDEPTAGLDPASRRGLHATLRQFQRDGIEIILSSHSMIDIAELTQKLTIMSNGRSTRTDETWRLFNDAQLIDDSSLIQPAAVRMTAALREKGWPVTPNAVTPQNVIDQLKAITGRKSA